MEKAVSYLAYMLAKSLNKDTIEMLWWAIVGSCYLHIYNKISSELSDDVTYDFQRDVIKRNKEKPKEIIDGIKVSSSRIIPFSIGLEQDYNILLLKHWNLYDSAFYSSYIASKLNTWKEEGKKGVGGCADYQRTDACDCGSSTTREDPPPLTVSL